MGLNRTVAAIGLHLASGAVLAGVSLMGTSEMATA
jgi:hypothetical protein